MKNCTVAHLIATNFYGGPEKQIINHASQLFGYSKKYKPLIVSFQEQGRKNEIIAMAEQWNIAHASINAEGAVNLRAITKLTNILKQSEVSILVSHGYKANVIGRLSSWRVGIPMVAVSRGWTSENWKIWLYQLIDKMFLRFASHIVAVSEGQREKIVRLVIPSDKVSVIHNAINLGSTPPASEFHIRDELGLPGDAILICTAGRLSPEKNQTVLIDAAKILCAQHSNIYFIIFGEGGCREALEKKIHQFQLSQRFFLPGFRKDLLSVLHEVDIFTLPSHTEGLPNVILEAYSCCKPVVASHVGGTPEVVQHGITGLLHLPDDVDTLVRYLAQLADDKALRLRMGESGYNFVRDQFTYGQQLDRYVQLYDRIHNGHAT